MTNAAFAAGATPRPPGEAGYRPGTCNIGPAEIARRRRLGHLGLLGAVVLSGALLVVDAPPAVRLIVALPAAAAASGYLQARLRFCAGFGARGVFNFGPLGGTEKVTDPAALARDRRKARRIGVASLAVGVAAGVVAALLPV